MPEAFQPIVDAAKYMRDFSRPWFISGGWAIDLFLGTVTREHSDIEIGIYRCDQHLLRDQFLGWSFEKAVQRDGEGTWVPWETGEALELPIHQIRVTKADAALPEFELFLNERSETHWWSRRHAELKRPLAEVVMTGAMGLPALAPEIQLLFKAKYTRPKDQADFDLAVPRMTKSQRDWLDGALREYHPGHPWIAD